MKVGVGVGAGVGALGCFSPASRIILIESLSLVEELGLNQEFQSRKQDYFN